MKLINYVEYKHSYAHALAPKLKTLNYQANVQKKPVQYIRKIIINALNENDEYVEYTKKSVKKDEALVNKITKVIRKGYKIHDRVITPATVVVGKAKQVKEEVKETESENQTKAEA